MAKNKEVPNQNLYSHFDRVITHYTDLDAKQIEETPIENEESNIYDKIKTYEKNSEIVIEPIESSESITKVRSDYEKFLESQKKQEKLDEQIEIIRPTLATFKLTPEFNENETISNRDQFVILNDDIQNNTINDNIIPPSKPIDITPEVIDNDVYEAKPTINPISNEDTSMNSLNELLNKPKNNQENINNTNKIKTMNIDEQHLEAIKNLEHGKNKFSVSFESKTKSSYHPFEVDVNSLTPEQKEIIIDNFLQDHEFNFDTKHVDTIKRKHSHRNKNEKIDHVIDKKKHLIHHKEKPVVNQPQSVAVIKLDDENNESLDQLNQTVDTSKKRHHLEKEKEKKVKEPKEKKVKPQNEGSTSPKLLLLRIILIFIIIALLATSFMYKFL